MDILLGLKEAQQITPFSYSKLLRLAKSGELPFKKLGATWVIPRSALYRALGMELPEDEEVPKDEHAC